MREGHYQVGWWRVGVYVTPLHYRWRSTEFWRKSWMGLHRAEVEQDQRDADARIEAFNRKFGSVGEAFKRR